MSDGSPQAGYGEFKGWNSRPFGSYKRHWGAYYSKTIDTCLRLAGAAKSRELRLLEIGFGNGSFMGWARDQGHSVVGVEIQSAQLIAARRAGFQVAESLEMLEREANLTEIDGVVALDVFEHLSQGQLVALMTASQMHLKANGWIFARHPNGDSPFGRMNQHGDLTHVTALGSAAMAQLAIASGVSLACVRADVMPVLGVGVIRLLINCGCLVARVALEIPTQMLLNVYYPGTLRWYPLTPNLLSIFLKTD
jgi:2-polyprenyl-3-methyl-5-hydroxy-6-metoxy-1,4-benzoquinol methylase